MGTRAESEGPAPSPQACLPIDARQAREQSANRLHRCPANVWSLRGFILMALAFGTLCRVSQYAAGTSVWHDEAFVALNAAQKTFAGLLGSLEWNEASPPGFLIVEKIVILTLGRSEYALRLIPLLAGIAAMIGLAVLARRVCGTGMASLWAVVLAAASPNLIAHANLVKHFTLDMLWAVSLVWLADRIWPLDRPVRMLLVWGALGAVGPWFSFASVFVFAGTSLTLGARAVRTWRGPARAAYLLANLEVLATLALLLGPIRAQATGRLVDFWLSRGAFPDTQSLWSLGHWLLRSGSGVAAYFWRQPGPALLALILLGGVRWWRTGRRPELCLVLLPALMALFASALHRWPFGGNQHMVLAAPAAVLLMAEGMDGLGIWLARWQRWARWALVALFLLPGVINAAYRVAIPRQRHELRPVILFVQRNLEPGDHVLVFDPVTFMFYAGRDLQDAPTAPDILSRVWFISIRDGYKRSTFTGQDVLDGLEARRPRMLAIERYGAAAYLFGPEHPPRGPAPPGGASGGDAPPRGPSG